MSLLLGGSQEKMFPVINTAQPEGPCPASSFLQKELAAFGDLREQAKRISGANL